MPRLRLALICTLACLATACGLPPSQAASDPGSARASLAAYRGEDDMMQALAHWRSEAQKQQAARRERALGGVMLNAAPAMAPAAPAPAPAAAKSADAGAAGAAESITNVQTAGVDEGGIVKRAGDHLVILRRGRLFTVRIGGDQLQPTSMVDAYAPGSNPQGAWYDELLISGSTVVVIGYSYARGGTEVGLFELGAGGALSYRATYHLRSFDYYSSRNYASRLVGRTLVFYSPTVLQPWGPPPQEMLPGVRRWQGEATPPAFERILPATRVYRTDDDFDPRQALALHTVTSCELGAADMRCGATAVLGPVGRVFYVSAGSVYVWTGGRSMGPRPTAPADASSVFRIPLDGSAPTGLKTAGMPIDQMSFLEDERGHLNVLLRDGGFGEGMFAAERGAGAMALLRVPLAAFGDGRGAARREHYRQLPAMAGHGVQNRFVGDWLLWGGAAARPPSGEMLRTGADAANAWALRYADAAAPVALSPGHGVERIEALGRDAVLVGNAGSELNFSAVQLGRGDARLAGVYRHAGARQGETRTHGFFYRPTGADEGLLGLPVLGAGGARRPGVFAGAQGSASVLFLRQRALNFRSLGELEARASAQRDDACKASCVDWYGNARPIFLGERVFALMGYELVEGSLGGRGGAERIDERRRISFAPDVAQREGRYSPFN